MSYSIGPRLGIQGDGEYRKAIEQVIQQGKTLQSEMDAVAKGFKSTGDATQDYQTKVDVLNKQITAQEELIRLYTEQMERAAKEYGENSTQALKFQEQINKAQGGLAEMQQSLASVTSEFEEQQRATEESGESLDELSPDLKSASEGANELSENVGEVADSSEDASDKASIFGEVLKAELLSKAIIEGVKSLADAFKKVGEAITGAFTDSVAWADELNTLSTQTGISTEKLQEWEYMASLIDVDVNTLTASNTKLIKTMASAQSGTASATEAFSQLGVSFQNTDGSLRDSETVMMEVFNALGQVANETERDALAMTIFGKSAQELNPLIKAGEETLNALAQEAHDVGYVLDTEAIDSLNRTQDAMDRMQNASDGLVRQMSAQFAPLVADAFESVIPVINKFGGTIADVFKGNKTIDEFVDDVMDALDECIINFERNAPQFLKQGEALLTSLVNGIERTVPKLVGLVVPMLQRLAQTFISNLGTILDTGIKILLQLIQGITQAIPSLIQQIPTIISTIVTVLLNNLPAIIKAGIQILVALIQGIIQMIPNLVQSAGQIISAIWNALKQAPALMLEVGSNIVEGIWKGISNGFGWIKQKISGWVGDVVGFFKRVLGIHSPSKVFADVVGANMALGIGEGFEDEMSSVARSMTNAIPMSFGASGSGSYRQTNLGGVNITVNGAAGQNVQELADEIMYRMQTAVTRREAVFA